MRIESEERLDGLLKFMGCSIQDIAKANENLSKNGLEACVIRVPRAYLMGIPVEFADVESVDVAAEDDEGLVIAYAAENKTK